MNDRTILIREITRIGHRTRRGSPSGVIHAFAAALAIILVSVSAMSIAVAVIEYSVKVDNSAAREPYASDGFNPSNRSVAPILFGGRTDTLADGMQYDVIILAQHAPGVAPPPGIRDWPAPGEAYLSPQLLEDGEDEGIATRYGTTVGLIQPTGLGASDERFAYVNPIPGTFPAESLDAYERFGRTPEPWWSLSLSPIGETAYIFPAFFLLAVVLTLGVVPALVLAYVARSVGVQRRHSRQLLFRTLGARPATERLARLGEVLVPATVAGAAVSGLLIFGLTFNFRIPLTGYLISSADLRQQLPVLAGAALLGGAGALAILVLDRPRSQRGSTKAKLSAYRFPSWLGYLSPLLFASAFRVPSWIDPAGRQGWLLAYLLCVLVCLSTLPFFLAVLLRGFARRLERSARRWGWPSVLLAVRGTVSRPGALLTTIAAICIGTGLLFQVQFLSNKLQQRARFAVQTAERLDGRLTLAGYDYGIRNLAKIRNDLGKQVETLVVTAAGTEIVVAGSCPALQALELRCEAGPVNPGVHELLAYATDVSLRSNVRIELTGDRVSTQRSGEQQLVVVSPRPLNLGEVKAAVIKNSWPNDGPASPAFGYAGSAFANAHQGLWVSLFGVFGLLCVLLAISFGLVGQFTSQARRTAPLIALTGRTRPQWIVSAWVLLLPTVLAGVGGVLASLWLAQIPISIQLAAPFGGGLAVAIVIVVVGMGLGTWVLGARIAIRDARAWLPGHNT